jgi:hypothetical protein
MDEILYTENGGLNWTINRAVTRNYITSINFSDSLNGTMTGFSEPFSELPMEE